MIEWKRRTPAVTAYRQVFALWLSVGVVLIAGKVGADPTPEANWVAKVVSIQGNVWVRKPMDRQWQVVNLDDHFLAGDEIQVGRNSRAAFVLCNDSTLRVDQQTTLVFSEAKPKKPLLMELIAGTVHFFSRIHRSLHLTTPFVNGAVEGTEFVVRVETDQATITLIEGRMTVSNQQGSARLWPNQAVTVMADQPPVQMAVVRPWDAVHWALYYPAIIDFKPGDFPCEEQWCAAVRQSVEAWRRGDLPEAFETVSKVPEAIDHPRLQLYRAALQLAVGRVDEATAALDQVRLSAAQQSDALSLLAVIAVVQNRKEAARQLVNQAAAAASTGSGADMAGSYVQQAFFDLEAALASVRTAVQKEPHNALAWARLSELYLSKGDHAQALAAARRAVDIQPDLSHPMIVLGFAHLAQIKKEPAKRAFSRAISLDSAAPMARLGMGLVKIRDGQLAKGRGEIEIAACLDPGNALIRSYLGKAYYEEKRDDPAQVQLTAAKQLDPADPTPWFYDAVRKQTVNRPVEALQDMQRSIALNDNRAVYRSRLLLDEDLAARSAGLARIYGDLGFQRLALVEGWKSLNTDPSNFSGHRFLSDAYAGLPRHEIARVSELLQAQLLQPINISPVGPHQAESRLTSFQGTGPTSPSFNEFNPLFNRNQVGLHLSGVVGGNGTLGDEAIVSGIHDHISFSLGQFYHETDGFRDNNDVEENIYNAFIQASLTPKASIQAEIRAKEKKSGDLELLFNPQQFNPNERNSLDVRTYRLGGRYSFSPGAQMIASFIDQRADETLSDYVPDIARITVNERTDGYSAELQHLFRATRFNLVSGGGYVDGELEEVRLIDIMLPFVPDPDPFEKRTPLRHGNAYAYSQLQLLESVNLTGGLSYDDFDNDRVDKNQVNPKLGLTWQPFSGTTFRGAVFRVLTRTLLNDQTVEPTQVAGFNQFYRDVPGTDIWTYGAALDQRLSADIYGGIEFTLRDLDVPITVIRPPAPPDVEHAAWQEKIGRAYLYWTPHPWLSGSSEYLYERWDRDEGYGAQAYIRKLTTHRLRLEGNFFHPSGFFAGLSATYADQTGTFEDFGLASVRNESDRFWVVDAALGYRFPKRLGMVSVEVKNLFDEAFSFQDTDAANPSIYPERLALVRLTFNF